MSDPLRVPRIAALGLSVAFAIVASCIGLNALIHEHRDIDHLKGLAPSPVVVNIDVSDADTTGKIATIANVVLAVLGLVFLILSLLPKTAPCSIKTLRLQALALLVPTLVVIGGMIPFMIVFVNRKPKVTAFLGSQQLPQSMVDQVKARSGAKDAYKDFWYMRLLAIFPWLSVLFALIAIGVTFLSSMRASSVAAEHDALSPAKDSASSDRGSSHHVNEKTTNPA